MPVWKVFDEETASELRSRVSGGEILLEERPVVLDGGDAVILVPTTHKGVTMLITARRKPETTIKQIPSFDALPAIEPIEESAPESVPGEPVVLHETEDEFFGPTTWERVEQSGLADHAFDSREVVEQAPEEYPVPGISSGKRVESIYDLPANCAEQVVTPGPIQQTVPRPQEEPRERHYVATGFLGLDETVEDEEDFAREKRPWWKKLFID